MVVIYGKSGSEVSKKGNCIAEWQVQKLNVPPNEKHRGRNISALFPVQTWRYLMKPAGDKKEKEKSQMSFTVKNAAKKIESPAPGYCGSHVCSWGCCECAYVCEPPEQELLQLQMVGAWGNGWEKVLSSVSFHGLLLSSCSGSLLEMEY